MLEKLCRSDMSTRMESSVVVLTERTEGEVTFSVPGVAVEVLGGARGGRWPRRIMRIREWVRQIRPHVLQGWMYHGNLAAWYARHASPEPTALAWNVRHSLHDLRREKMRTRYVIRANRVLSRHPEAIVYNSRKARLQHEEFGFSSVRGHVIPNGFELNASGPDTERGIQVRRTLGIPDAAIVIGHAARFHPMKDHYRFLRIASSIVQENRNVHIVLMGRDVTERNNELYSAVADGAVSRFHWLGERTDVFDVMQAMDGLCLTSAWGEAFPNVLGEAMSVGVPCVTTDVGDSAFVVGDCGFVVPPRDDVALYNALRDVIGMSDEERRAVGRRARERVRSKFGLDVVAGQYVQLYERLAAGATGGWD
jgi:glycosyltransferase involved in cell wall biosynthesis